MQISSFFNDNFLSSAQYYKLGVVITKADTLRDVFAIVKNKATGKIECQKYFDLSHKRADDVTHGRDKTASFLQNEELKKLNMNNFFDEKILQSKLHESMQKYLLACKLQEGEKQEVRNFLASMFDESIVTTEENITTPISEEWKDCDFSSFETDDLINLAKLHEIAKEKGESDFEFNGKKYRFIPGDAGSFILQVLSDNTETSSVSIENKTRKFIQMAKIINANGLSEVVNGNFYPIVDSLAFNGKGYVTIDVNGEKRNLEKSRVNVISVFTEKP